MANSDKDIKITPNTNQTAQPKIEFIGSSSAPITLSVLDDNSLSFQGGGGQLFSITNNLTVGSIFSVNDVSGLPIIDVSSSGEVVISNPGLNVPILNVGIDRSLLPSNLATNWHDNSKINFSSLREQNRTSVLSIMQQTDATISGTLGVASYTSGSTNSSTNNSGIWCSARHLGNSDLNRLSGVVSFPLVDGNSAVSDVTSFYGYTEVDGGATITYNQGLWLDSPAVINGTIDSNYAIYVDDQDSANINYSTAIYVEANRSGYYVPFVVHADGQVNIGADDVTDYKLFVREYVDNTSNTLALIDSLSIDQNNASTKNFHQNIRSRTFKSGGGTTDQANNFLSVYYCEGTASGSVNYYSGFKALLEDAVGANTTFNDVRLMSVASPSFAGNSTINYLHGLYIEPMTEGAVLNYMIYGATTSSLNPFVVTGDGKVGIGTYFPTAQLELSADSAVKPNGGTWSSPSDLRLKTNIVDYKSGLQEILNIRPVTFEYNGKAGTPAGSTSVGVVAQEIKQVMPETVKTYHKKLETEDTEDTELYEYNPNSVIYALVNAIKELNARIEDLTSEIEELKKG